MAEEGRWREEGDSWRREGAGGGRGLEEGGGWRMEVAGGGRWLEEGNQIKLNKKKLY